MADDETRRAEYAEERKREPWTEAERERARQDHPPMSYAELMRHLQAEHAHFDIYLPVLEVFHRQIHDSFHDDDFDHDHEKENDDDDD